MVMIIKIIQIKMLNEENKEVVMYIYIYIYSSENGNDNKNNTNKNVK